MVLELMSTDFAICHMHLLGFLLILSRIHLIIDLDRCVVYYFVWVRGLPLLERSNKFPLSLKRVNVFQRVDLAIESIFAIAEYSAFELTRDKEDVRSGLTPAPHLEPTSRFSSLTREEHFLSLGVPLGGNKT